MPEAPPRVMNFVFSIVILLAILGFLSGITLIAGGLYLAFGERLAETTFTMFGNDFSSTSVGVSMSFMGALLAILTIRRVLESIEFITKLYERRY